MEEPIRIIMRWLLLPLFLLLFGYVLSVAISFVPLLEQPTGGASAIAQISEQVRSDLGNATWEVWRFVRPLLQLGVILLIIYSFTRALGIDLGLRATSQELSIQTILAFLVVGGFAVAALLSNDPASWLKDVTLVVIGFYFGSRTSGTDSGGPERVRVQRPPSPVAPSEGGAVAVEGQQPSNATERPTESNWRALGPYLGRRQNPSRLDSPGDFNKNYGAHPSGRRTGRPSDEGWGESKRSSAKRWDNS